MTNNVPKSTAEVSLSKKSYGYVTRTTEKSANSTRLVVVVDTEHPVVVLLSCVEALPPTDAAAVLLLASHLFELAEGDPILALEVVVSNSPVPGSLVLLIQASAVSTTANATVPDPLVRLARTPEGELLDGLVLLADRALSCHTSILSAQDSGGTTLIVASLPRPSWMYWKPKRFFSR